MKQSHTLGWIAAGVLVVMLVAVGWIAWGPGSSSAGVISASASPNKEPLDPIPADSQSRSERETGATREALALSESSGPELALEASPVTTRLVARFVDPSGMPVAGAKLWLRDDEGEALSDVEGRVQLSVPESALRTLPVQQLTTRFVVEAEGYATRYLMATPTAGLETDLGELVLQPGGSLAGIVIDGAGQPLTDVRIIATGVELDASIEMLRSRGPATEEGLSTTSSQEGRFVVSGVPVGHARLWARATRTGWVVSAPCPVRAGEKTDGLRLVLPALDSEDLILGVVLDSTGNPVRRSRVRYLFPSAGFGYRTVTGDEAEAGSRSWWSTGSYTIYVSKISIGIGVRESYEQSNRG